MDGISWAAKSVCQFVRRHRRTIGIGVTVGVGVALVLGVRDIIQEAEAQQLKQEEEAKTKQRHRKYLSRASSESVIAVLPFLETLRKRVDDAVDVKKAVRRLKAVRKREQAAKASEEEGNSFTDAESLDEKDALWEELKIRAFTLWAVALYSFCVITLVMQLQLHILNRYALIDEERKEARHQNGPNQQEPASTRFQPELTYEVRHQLLAATFDYLLGPGLLQLVADARRAVQEVFTGWDHKKTDVRYEDLVSKFQELRNQMEVSQHQFQQYIIRPDAPEKPGSLTQQLLNETWDAIESPHFYASLQDCLSLTVENACSCLKSGIFVASTQKKKENSELVSDSSSANESFHTQPLTEKLGAAALAALIPQIRRNAYKLLDNDQGNFFLNEIVHTTSANSFCWELFNQR